MGVAAWVFRPKGTPGFSPGGLHFLGLIMKVKKGQAAIEYFILFTIIAVITILSFSTFLPKVKEAIQGSNESAGFFQKAAQQITQ